MSHLIKLIQSFSKDESGAALVEYAVIFAILLAGTVAALSAIAPELDRVFGEIEGVLFSINDTN